MLGLIALLLVTAGNPGDQSTPKAREGERASDPSDKMICKRFVETGSLVRAQRVCKTKRDWERDRANIRSEPGIDSCRARANGGAC